MTFIVLPHLRDADDQAKALVGWEQEHEQLGCGWFRGSAWQLLMQEGCIHREVVNLHHRQLVQPPKDHIVLSMALAVNPGSRFDGRPLSPECLLVFDGRSPHEVVSSGEIDVVGMTVNLKHLESLLAPEVLEWLLHTVHRNHVLLPSVSAIALRRSFEAICIAAERHGDGDLLPVHEQELLSTSLTELVELSMLATSRECASSIPNRSQVRQKVVQRAVDFMRANLREDICVADICAASFASRRTVHYCFWDFLHTTPQAYLRALRLNEARRALKLPSYSTLTQMAVDLGFSNASHFTRLYKDMFGELPSRTRYASQLVGKLQ